MEFSFPFISLLSFQCKLPQSKWCSIVESQKHFTVMLSSLEQLWSSFLHHAVNTVSEMVCTKKTLPLPLPRGYKIETFMEMKRKRIFFRSCITMVEGGEEDCRWKDVVLIKIHWDNPNLTTFRKLVSFIKIFLADIYETTMVGQTSDRNLKQKFN